MKMSELEFEGAQPPIDGYAPGGFRVRGAFYDGSLLIGPDSLSTWPAASIQEVDSDAAIAPLLALAGRVDVVLVGAGEDIAPFPAARRAELEAAGLGVETMSTSSASRTYNVLLSEGRRVAAALIAL
ncbi:MAG: Mth938-like domain-containing protein [Rhodobacteraceae bacterium]|nr:Mth938-like domain-containing protein [Paracoccaceae bacterium]